MKHLKYLICSFLLLGCKTGNTSNVNKVNLPSQQKNASTNTQSRSEANCAFCRYDYFNSATTTECPDVESDIVTLSLKDNLTDLEYKQFYSYQSCIKNPNVNECFNRRSQIEYKPAYKILIQASNKVSKQDRDYLLSCQDYAQDATVKNLGTDFATEKGYQLIEACKKRRARFNLATNKGTSPSQSTVPAKICSSQNLGTTAATTASGGSDQESNAIYNNAIQQLNCLASVTPQNGGCNNQVAKEKARLLWNALRPNTDQRLTCPSLICDGDTDCTALYGKDDTAPLKQACLELKTYFGCNSLSNQMSFRKTLELWNCNPGIQPTPVF